VECATTPFLVAQTEKRDGCSSTKKRLPQEVVAQWRATTSPSVQRFMAQWHIPLRMAWKEMPGAAGRFLVFRG
jgi:hypothetical protein